MKGSKGGEGKEKTNKQKKKKQRKGEAVVYTLLVGEGKERKKKRKILILKTLVESFGHHKNQNLMTMDLLGPNLEVGAFVFWGGNINI